jgi:sugar (pentulose or hexulose) kinase
MALDAGTGAARCFIVSLDGKTSYDTYQEWQYSYPEEASPGGSEFDPHAFWQIFINLIKRTLTEHNLSSEQVLGISSTCQREGIVLLDKFGNELYAGPNTDARAPTYSNDIALKFGEIINANSGHWPFPMFAPYRLLWFKEKKPEIYKSIKTMLLINDWILYRLSGKKSSEPSNGNETLLMDLRTQQWNRKLIENLQLLPDIFPPIVASGTCIGHVSREVAEVTGLKTGTPVIAGGADTQCALLGTGSINEGQITTVFGSYAPSQMVVSTPIIDQHCRIWSGCHVVPNKWVVESTAMEAGAAFRWIRDVFYEGGDTNKYREMDDEASHVPVGARGIQAFIGPRVPDYKNLKFFVRGGFFFSLPPVPGSANRSDFTRSVLESIAYGVRANIDRIKLVTGIPASQLRICGGLSKSKTLHEILANVMNMPVLLPEQKEGSAMGACLCAAIGSQQMKSFQEAVSAMVHPDRILEPEKEKVEAYKDLYGNWYPLLPLVHGEEGLGDIK